jgi:hypothetical protein
MITANTTAAKIAADRTQGLLRSLEAEPLNGRSENGRGSDIEGDMSLHRGMETTQVFRSSQDRDSEDDKVIYLQSL